MQTSSWRLRMVGNEWEASQGPLEVRLMEEAAELIQALSKSLRFGWDMSHPHSGVVNRAYVLDEMQDLVLKWNELAEREGLPHFFMRMS